MLNESAIGELGWTPEEALGKKVNFGGSIGYIKAVVRDFYFNSLHYQVGPLAIMIEPNQANVLLVQLSSGNPLEHLAALEDIWKILVPDRPFNYKFVDQEYERLYRSEERVGSIFRLFAGIAVFVACMGLFGLVSYVALRRTKEIGIRKVLGAGVSNIVVLLSRDFVKLVVLAIVIATPVSWYTMNRWLEGFAYKIDVSWWIYPLAGILAIAVALLTICFHSIKAALMNPVDSLRSE
jgi:putative ABC transport system permease protein